MGDREGRPYGGDGGGVTTPQSAYGGTGDRKGRPYGPDKGSHAPHPALTRHLPLKGKA